MSKEVDGSVNLTLTCTHCYLTYDKYDIQPGQMTRCPRCDGLVVA